MGWVIVDHRSISRFTSKRTHIFQEARVKEFRASAFLKPSKWSSALSLWYLVLSAFDVFSIVSLFLFASLSSFCWCRAPCRHLESGARNQHTEKVLRTDVPRTSAGHWGGRPVSKTSVRPSKPWRIWWTFYHSCLPISLGQSNMGAAGSSRPFAGDCNHCMQPETAASRKTEFIVPALEPQSLPCY